ncbi:hypothetical protein P7D22_13640 [Lichenihabitans sp. Uapishka_5]|uniref:hypothetical protein n=1 Tax=Lichenihabitans sp. Uapishka_5 TaxID=3037302 RepID=UPI0029E7D091|nr:hypothetical protein [Lichenihabitans sp. Uapishka_5]MDX7952217.1 hypothetical protein [Lichenihabitans sp. Uapishka_5]
MASKRPNSLREYHLLVARHFDGFEWQIRYDHHANPVRRSEGVFGSQNDAVSAGEVALAALKRQIASEAEAQEGGSREA